LLLEERYNDARIIENVDKIMNKNAIRTTLLRIIASIPPVKTGNGNFTRIND
jgi:hypothetical protein